MKIAVSMNRRVLGTVISAVTLLPVLGQAPKKSEAVPVPPGFINGRDYRDLPNGEKLLYLAGYYDGMLGSTLLGSEVSRAINFQTCIPGLTLEQLRAIVDKFLADHPDRWGDSMNVLVYASLPQACRENSGKWIDRGEVR